MSSDTPRGSRKHATGLLRHPGAKGGCSLAPGRLTKNFRNGVGQSRVSLPFWVSGIPERLSSLRVIHSVFMGRCIPRRNSFLLFLAMGHVTVNFPLCFCVRQRSPEGLPGGRGEEGRREQGLSRAGGAGVYGLAARAAGRDQGLDRGHVARFWGVKMPQRRSESFWHLLYALPLPARCLKCAFCGSCCRMLPPSPP